LLPFSPPHNALEYGPAGLHLRKTPHEYTTSVSFSRGYYFVLMPDPTLLVIEDAREHAILVRVAARRALPGLDVRVAGDGREGIAYLAGTPPFQDRRSHPLPSLIILDLIMPEIDGFEVLKWIKEKRGPDKLPVVVLTSSLDPEAETKSMALGATAYYRKPTDLDGLGKVVREIVESFLGEELLAGSLGSSF
jgi:two-component system response regulator